MYCLFLIAESFAVQGLMIVSEGLMYVCLDLSGTRTVVSS